MKRTFNTWVNRKLDELDNVVYQVHVYMPHDYTHQGTGLANAKSAGTLKPASDTPRKWALLVGFATPSH